MVLDFTGKRVWVVGHNGMLGRALSSKLQGMGANLLKASRSELDLTRQAETEAWVLENKPDLVFLAAAKVGGILANHNYPSSFLYNNLVIGVNVVHACAQAKVEKLLNLGTGCIYPKLAEQPVKEESLLTGSLEPTNQWYAMAKISIIKLCQAYKKELGHNFISAMPTNLYGPYDNFDLETSHFLPALMRKIHRAKVNGEDQVEIWGTGKPYRELMHADDCADALIHVMQHYDDNEIINVGTGEDQVIQSYAEKLSEVIGWHGEFVYDSSKPDGTMRKVLDISKLRSLGWRHKISHDEGFASVYKWFLENEVDDKLLAS